MKRIWLFLVACLFFMFAFFKVNDWWMVNQYKAYPCRGDWEYYVQCCNHISPDFPVVSLLLHSTNFFLQDSTLTVLCMMIFGCALVYISTFMLPYIHGCHPLGCLVGSSFVILSPNFLQPAVLKNVWGIVFLFISLTILLHIEKQITTRNFLGFAGLLTLTFLTHTLAIFVVLPILTCYAVWSHQKKKARHTFLFLTALTATGMALLVGASTSLPTLGFGKLIAVITTFTANPFGIIHYNLVSLATSQVGLAQFIIFIIVAGLQTVFSLQTRTFDPLYYGLLLAYAGLFFLGSEPFAGRFHETGIPILGVLYARTVGLLIPSGALRL